MPVNTIHNCSSSAIDKALKKIAKEQLKKSRIIGPGNYYLKQTRIKTNSMSATPTKNGNMTQYIAASCIQHCCDGWNYLSRGVEALLNGDIPSTVHLVYYSELRSAMAMMARMGIGVFDTRHIYYDASDQPHIVPPSSGKISTHEYVKELLNNLKGMNNKNDIIFKAINVESHSLIEWINTSRSLSNSPLNNAILDKYFELWSIDLNFKEDQTIRNESSYRPNYFPNKAEMSKIINTVTEIWQLLEPQGSGGFERFDQYLLRSVLKEIFKGVTSLKTKANFIYKIMEDLGIADKHLLREFLLKNDKSNIPSIFAEAKKDKNNRLINMKNPLPMVCRAILLLRLSTGMVLDIIQQNSIPKDDMSAWWKNLAFISGVVERPDTQIEARELYADVSDAISQLSSMSPSYPMSVYNFNSNFIREATILKQFQRSYFWGIGL